MSQQRTITIVGAGLVGSLLAVLLGRRGWSVDLFEKRPDMRLVAIPAGRSINLALAERGLAGLRLAALDDRVRQLLIPMSGRLVHQLDGQTEFVPYGQRADEVIYSISRPGLNQLLMTAAEETGNVRIWFGCECREVDFERHTLRFVSSDGHDTVTSPFGVVVGADGAASVLRQSIVAATGGEASVDMLDHDYKELSIPAGASGEFQMARDALHIWPRGGFMLIALPNLDASFTVTLFLPKVGHPSFADLNGPRAVRELFNQEFPDASRLIAHLEDDFFAHPTGELGTVRCWPWAYRDEALVMGDAAHAIVPFHGQGMNAGFEDCVELMRLVDQHGDDWSAILDSFQRRRKPNADAIAQMALENYIDMRDTVRSPDFQSRKALGFELERRFPDRFVPRYSMVMFHRVPYREALSRGAIQERILDSLLASTSDWRDVDFSAAERLVHEQLKPLDRGGDAPRDE